MANDKKHSIEEYQLIVEKIKQGTATEEERSLIEDLVSNAMKEVDETIFSIASGIRLFQPRFINWS